MKTTNVIIAGLGGQGVLTSSDILAEAALISGLDVKKSEIHGMSQRGGSVASDVRFGGRVLSPMVPAGQADFLVVLDSTQVDLNRPALRRDGVLITPEDFAKKDLPHYRSLNIALLGVLSRRLPELGEPAWIRAIGARLPAEIRDVNVHLFLRARGAKP